MQYTDVEAPFTTESWSDASRAIRNLVERRTGWTTIGISLLACLISSVRFTSVSMWVDEGYTVSVATRSLHDVWRMVQNIDVVHSLYNVILHPVLAVFGISEVTVRLPSLLALGVATAGVMVLTRRLAGSQASLAAGLIFAILPRVTWMGIEGRSYAATAAVAVWLTVLFVSLTRKPTRGKLLGYAVLVAFACSLNIFLVLLLGAHGLCLLLEPKLRLSRTFWAWLGAAVVGLAGGLPVLLTAVAQSGQIGDERLGLPGYARNILVNQWFLGATPTVYLSGGGSVTDGPGSGLWKPASVLLAALYILVMIWSFRRRHPGASSTVPNYRFVLGCWMVVPTAVLVGYSCLGTPLYNPRYLTYCSPAVASLVAIGLVDLRQLGHRWSSACNALVVLLVLLTIPIFASQRSVYSKSGADWKLVAEFVAAHPGAGRAVYFAPRVPPTSDAVVLTSRTAQTLYPASFADVRDLTLSSTAAEQADIWGGRSRTLAASTDRLEGIRTVFVVNRIDYPAQPKAADESVLLQAGFRPTDRWAGPLNEVVEFTR